MNLILTHENADFDAIASLLAAALLYPEATAIIPHQLNQNVRDFLTLYWGELPFAEHGEQPINQVEQLTLVDTQYAGGFNNDLRPRKLRIIDHHAPGANLPPEAETIFVQSGANVTYLVEEIIRANLQISAIHATLMALGIYEDCGSLLYGNTTPRDIRAAAWLLEQGANLDTLRDFLYYRLNPAQQALYQLISTNLESHTIQGNQILISAVSIDEYVAEISNIVHRLRDLYNPDGLFLLVHMTETDPYIQLIARSTTEAIHVGRIAEKFGGGGHPRAAAARIKREPLDKVYRRLLTVLNTHIQPATTVRQIMSMGVHTFTPEQTIREADANALRYGFEGYPVVAEKKVIGLITRREIDKAMRHGLANAAVRQFMRQGEIYVSPDDTIETLQELMLREQVGQVPVIENHQIIGIVTRTDLINLWGRRTQPVVPGLNLKPQLEAALPVPLLDLLKEVGAAAVKIDSALYIVGGFVRDLLLKGNRTDIDLVVEGDAIALGKLMQARHGGRLHSHQRFGTANWITEGAIPGIERLDFVTARTEFYRHPTALPEVEPSSIKQDLHRRDFTINTLALCLSPERFGEVLDFYGGYHDIQNGTIRVLHSLSFVEDPTRILRAIRFEQRLGFQINARTMEHLKGARDLLARVSAKRVWTELAYILQEATPEKGIRRLDTLGILQDIYPRFEVSGQFETWFQALRETVQQEPWSMGQTEAVHYLGLLTFNMLPETVSALSLRLQLPARVDKPLQQIQAVKQQLTSLQQARRPSDIYHILAPYSDDALLVCWIAIEDVNIRACLLQFSQTLRHVTPLIDGRYLIDNFNLRPSPQFNELLTRLRSARLDGLVHTLEDEDRLVRNLLAKRETDIKKGEAA